MIKLLPDAVSDIPAALAAVRESSKLLAGCPRQNYHLAVAGALAHLEGQILSPPFAMSPRSTHAKTDPMREWDDKAGCILEALETLKHCSNSRWIELVGYRQC